MSLSTLPVPAIIAADDMSCSGSANAAAAANTSNDATLVTATTAIPIAHVAIPTMRASVSPTTVDETIQQQHHGSPEWEASMNLIALSSGHHHILPAVMRPCSPRLAAVRTDTAAAVKERAAPLLAPRSCLRQPREEHAKMVVRFAVPSNKGDCTEQQEQQQLEQPPFKKVRLDHHNHCNDDSRIVQYNAYPTMKTWTVSERQASFPLPRRRGARNPTAGILKLSYFRDSWDRVNRVGDAMDDTSADREAFVKDLFIRSLYRRRSFHTR